MLVNRNLPGRIWISPYPTILLSKTLPETSRDQRHTTPHCRGVSSKQNERKESNNALEQKNSSRHSGSTNISFSHDRYSAHTINPDCGSVNQLCGTVVQNYIQDLRGYLNHQHENAHTTHTHTHTQRACQPSSSAQGFAGATPNDGAIVRLNKHPKGFKGKKREKKKNKRTSRPPFRWIRWLVSGPPPLIEMHLVDVLHHTHSLHFTLTQPHPAPPKNAPNRSSRLHRHSCSASSS